MAPSMQLRYTKINASKLGQLLHVLFGYVDCQRILRVHWPQWKRIQVRLWWNDTENFQDHLSKHLSMQYKILSDHFNVLWMKLQQKTLKSLEIPYALSSLPDEFGLCKLEISGAR
jgi:hypothetical protein